MIQENSIKDEMNLSLLEMIGTNDVNQQCDRIRNWLNSYCHFDGIGFLLQDKGSTRNYFYTEAMPMNIVQNLVENLPRFEQNKEKENDVLFFGIKGGELDVFSMQENSKSPEPMGLAIPLIINGRSIGNLALVKKSATVRSLAAETPTLLSFIPLISYLINNSISHEEKNKKIRMLNLYQSVSSALGYITDIHELLGTIVGLIPIELHCEECSFLSYDINNNEFEFFSAVGETGNKLLKERFPANKGIAGRAVRERKTFVVNNVQNNSDFYRSIDENYKFKTKSIVAAPAILAEETFGVIEAINKVETEYFNIDDDQILSAIADVVALAVKNSKMFDYFVDSYCKIRQGANSCEGCKRPLKSWTPCAKDLGLC
jgi:hypothetical protein